MDYIDLNELDGPRTRWLDLGGIGLLVKYASPRESDRFRRLLMQQGIMRQKDGGVEINVGREADFYEAFAKQYLMDWRGRILLKGEPIPFTPQNAARLLAGHGGILRAVQEAIAEDEAFFGQNGNGATSS